MLHINSEINDSFILCTLNLILPEMYLATTIDDFLKNKSEIKPTKKILPFGVLLYNSAIVEFPEGTYNPLDEKTGVLSDLNSSIEISLEGLWAINEKEKSELKENMKLYDILTLYRPNNSLICMMRYETHGPLSISKERKLKFEFGKLGLSTA